MNKKELDELICELYGIQSVNTMIESQISKFVKERGYTFKDIGRAIYYYIEILNRPAILKYGIGIVPNVMADSRAYFQKLKKEEEERKKQGKELKKFLNKKYETILVRPKREKKGVVPIKIEDIK